MNSPSSHPRRAHSRRPHSRRAFLGLAAAAATAAAGVAAAVKAAGSGGTPQAGSERPRPAARRKPVSENQLPGDPDWDISHLGAPDAMMGYADRYSVLPGEPITLYASTTARSFTVSAFRMGWYHGDQARLVWRSATMTGRRQSQPTVTPGTNTVQTDWGPSVTVPTDDWPEGSYLLRMDAEAGAQRFVPVTVRSASTSGQVVLKNSTATWQAYNTWGGYDLYNGPGGLADYDNRSLAVSLDRPFDANGAFLFLAHERPLIQLAERLDLPLAYVTSMEIATDPHLLDGASALVSLGHDEYWAPPERANVTAARDAGMNVAFLGANAMFPPPIEYDRVNPDAPVERPIQVLSHSPLTCRGVNSYADSAYYTHASGAGVFNTGTMRWVGAFDPPLYAGFGVNQRGGAFVKRVTANVLRAFADGPAATKYPAHDNLDAMQEWAGDPIAAQHDLWPPVRL